MSRQASPADAAHDSAEGLRDRLRRLGEDRRLDTEAHRVINAALAAWQDSDAARVAAENRSDLDMTRVPVDLELADGTRSAVLLSLPRGAKIALDLQET